MIDIAGLIIIIAYFRIIISVTRAPPPPPPLGTAGESTRSTDHYPVNASRVKGSTIIEMHQVYS